MSVVKSQAKTAPVYQVGAVSHISSFGETMFKSTFTIVNDFEKFQHVYG